MRCTSCLAEGLPAPSPPVLLQLPRRKGPGEDRGAHPGPAGPAHSSVLCGGGDTAVTCTGPWTVAHGGPSVSPNGKGPGRQQKGSPWGLSPSLPGCGKQSSPRAGPLQGFLQCCFLKNPAAIKGVMHALGAHFILLPSFCNIHIMMICGGCPGRIHSPMVMFPMTTRQAPAVHLRALRMPYFV